MKRLLRSAPVQDALAWITAGYAELLIATLRWRVVGLDKARPFLDGPDGMVVLFWHGRIAQAIACRPFLGAKARSAIISLSPDGDFIARAAARLGFPALRGSSGRSGDGAKGGAAAFRAALTALTEGRVLLATPDGPRGPSEVMTTGPVQIAARSRAPTFLLGLACAPAVELDSWDRARLPFPFARAVAVVDGPVLARPAGSVGRDIAADWSRRLVAAQAKAESLLKAR